MSKRHKNKKEKISLKSCKKGLKLYKQIMNKLENLKSKSIVKIKRTHKTIQIETLKSKT